MCNYQISGNIMVLLKNPEAARLRVVPPRKGIPVRKTKRNKTTTAPSVHRKRTGDEWEWED